ncbi:hypothetical protein YE105_C0640 [Yersinia enterocolitica subsp. palearctica 105.5R(r)]|nr:hypothetical protein YE105_C0640 [Yersinia enterocolitica subsp. palearctica 105.5R(r)]CCO70495.1 unknown [Yersinia enterocolitica IP 10393]
MELACLVESPSANIDANRVAASAVDCSACEAERWGSPEAAVVSAAITEGVKVILNGNMAWMTIFAQITDFEIRVLLNDLV